MGEKQKELRPRSGSVSMKDGLQSFVVNELLAFAFDEAGRTPVTTVKSEILKFYTSNSITAAKKMLWENYSSSLPPMSSHRDTAKRSAADADVDDVMEAVVTIDSQKEGKKELHTVFVVLRNLRNLPTIPSHPHSAPKTDEQTAESIAKIMTRLEGIEHQMGYMSSLMHGDALQGKGSHPWLVHYGDDASECDTYITSVKHSMQCSSSGSSSNAPHREMPDAESPQRPASYAEAVRAHANSVTSAALPNSGAGGSTSGAKPHNEDFTLVKSRHKRRSRPKKSQPIVGSRKDTNLKAGPCLSDVFIYRVGKEVTEDDISKFLEDEGVIPRVLEMTSNQNAPAKSFHAQLECSDVRKVRSADFWPEGWCCRPWYPRRNHGDDK